MEIAHLVEALDRDPLVTVRPALAAVPDLALPADLMAFYALCDGADLGGGSPYPISISARSQLTDANREVVGEAIAGDRSSDWVIVCRGRTDEYVSLDLNPLRSGRCYDSHSDRHGIAGSCSIVAWTFTDLLQGLVDRVGRRHFWLEDGFEPLGDAYA